MLSSTTIRPAIILACLYLAVRPADAGAKDDVRVRVGMGAQLRPDYPGSGNVEMAPLWNVSVAKGSDMFDFEAPDDSFGITLLSKGALELGPLVNIEGGRSRPGDGDGLDKLGTTVEMGAFFQFDLSRSVRFRSELRNGIGGHKGFVASIGADRVWRDGDHYLLSIGPRLHFSNARYQRAWFEVKPRAADALALRPYRPDGGLHSIGAIGSASYQPGGRWGLFGFGRYDRLLGDAARSPIVRDLGSRNQFSVGAGLTYSFLVRI